VYWIYGSVLRLKFNRLVSRQNCKPVQHNKVKITWYTCIQFHRLINLDPGIQLLCFFTLGEGKPVMFRICFGRVNR